MIRISWDFYRFLLKRMAQVIYCRSEKRLFKPISELSLGLSPIEGAL